MRRKVRGVTGLVFLILCGALTGGSSLADGCQFVHLIDPDHQRVQVFPVGETVQYRKFDLRDGGSNQLTDIDFARVPGRDHSASFVTQGHYLRVIDHHQGVTRTIHVGQLTNLTNLRLSGVAAADLLEVRGQDNIAQSQYALYLVGNAAEGPVFIVLDQQAILDGQTDASTLIASGSLCVAGSSCGGSPRSIAAATTPHLATPQVAFASVLGWDEQNNRQQQFYRITRGDAPDGPFEVTLDPWQRGRTWNGSRHRYMGVEFDSRGRIAAGAFQTEQEIRDLDTGTSSCRLAGDPTDLAIWGPSKGVAVQQIQFVTYEHDGQSVLASSPWLECPDPDGLLSDQPLVTSRPTAVCLSAPQSRHFWAYVAGVDGPVTGIEYELLSDGKTERLRRLSQFELSDPQDCQPHGRATQLAIGGMDLSFAACPVEPTCDGNPDPPVPCCLDPDDPDPGCDDCSGYVSGELSGPFTLVF